MLLQITLDESFNKHIGALEDQFKDEIAIVMRGLTKHGPYFDPGDDYVVERNEVEDYVACHHVKGWCG